jgi:hypothetical protein
MTFEHVLCCGQETLTTDVSDDENRTRTREVCQVCASEYYGCCAKRLSDKPDREGNRNWWGDVGVWHFHRADSGAEP